MTHGRAIPAGLMSALQAGVVRLCVCVRVTRQDGQVLAFTTHDRSVVLDGVEHEASSAVQSTNLRQEAGGAVDNVDVVGALSSDRITDEDLRAGAYDNADVLMSVCDWSDPSLGSVVLLRGNIGDITLVDGSYTAGFSSLMQRMQQQIGELYSPTCRVFHLGDERCKFNLSGTTLDGNPAKSVVSVSDILSQVSLRLAGGVDVVGYYNYGELKALSGRNTGHAREVKQHGESDSLSSAVINAPGLPSSALPFKRSYDFSASGMLTFTIPAGVWESVTMLLSSHWVIRDVTKEGTDQLAIQLPSGRTNDVVVRSNLLNGAVYTDSLQFGANAVNAVNTAAGGTLNVVVRHTQASSENVYWFNVFVNSASISLVGPGGGTSSRVTLHEAFPYRVSVGDVFEATTGCNRLSGTCTRKFGNIVNFRGEPHLPGTEKLLERGRPPG